MPAIRELQARVMACRAQLVAVGGPPGLLERARARLEDLERRWSRFLATSEITALNEAGGRPVQVSEPTLDLVGRALDAWRRTGGLFDATILPALVSAGYEASFDHIQSSAHPAGPPRPASDGGGIDIDRGAGWVRLPAGTRFDPGGIGKGLAADMIVADLLDGGAAGACVNLGGDVRFAGDPGTFGQAEGAPHVSGWRVGVEDPFERNRLLATVTMAEGAVATSSRVFRSWERAGATYHHLIDPATGSPAWNGLAAVTVLADTATWAEVAAKSLFLCGPDGAAITAVEWGVTGFAVDDGGEAYPFAGLDDRLEWACWR